MTKKKAHYTERDVETWNVRDFHNYLTDYTAEKFNTKYLPGGQGAISTRWRMEQGMLKKAIADYGAKTIKLFIDNCIATYIPNGTYLYISFSFMLAWRQNDLQRARHAVDVSEQRKKLRESAVRDAKETGVDSDWF